MRRVTGHALFLPVMGLSVFYVILLGNPWMVGHDTLNDFFHFHFFLSSLLNTGEFPLWSPHVEWGKSQHFWYFITVPPSSYLVGALAYVAKFLGATLDLDLARIWYAGFFLDELVLLVGTYALGTCLFRSRTAILFVTVALVGTVGWQTQRYFNFESYYALPLCFALALKTIQTRNTRGLALALVVLLVSGLAGSGLYLMCLHLLCFSVFFAACLYSCDVSAPKLILRTLKEQRGLLLFALLICLCSGLILLDGGIPKSIVHGRDADGTPLYANYLTYGPRTSLDTVFDLFTGITSGLDGSVYVGVIALPLAIVGILSAPAPLIFPFLCLGGFLFLFALGADSFLGPLIFHVPGIRIFRHLGTTVTVAKVALVFIAGFGWEAVAQAKKGTEMRQRASWCVGILVCCALFTLYWHRPELRESSRLFLVLSLQILFAVYFLHFSIHKNSPSLKNLYLLLGFVAVDAFSYRSSVYHALMLVTPSREFRALLKPQKLEFQAKREEDLWKVPGFRAAFAHLYPFDTVTNESFEACVRTGKSCPRPRYAVYDAIDGAVNTDACTSWFQPFALEPNTVSVLSLFNLARMRSVISPLDLNFNYVSPAVRFAAGCEGSKLQWHANVQVVPGGRELREELMANWSDAKLVAIQADMQSYLEERGEVPRHANTRQIAEIAKADFSVTHFSPNKVEIALAPGRQQDGWLYYADAYHPGWKAYVDDKQVPLLRTNGAFKAVEVSATASMVRFVFGEPWMQLLLSFHALCSVMLLAGVVWLGVRIDRVFPTQG